MASAEWTFNALVGAVVRALVATMLVLSRNVFGRWRGWLITNIDVLIDDLGHD